MNGSTNTGSTSVFEDPVASRFVASRSEVTIDRSAQDVWSVLTDLSYSGLKLWNPDVVSVTHISGEPRQENELVLVAKHANTGQAPNYLRTIRIVPNQQSVLRADAVDGSYMAFVDHSLYELGVGKTKLIYNGYIEIRRVPVQTIKEFDFKSASEDMMKYLNRTSGELLKKAVEERSPVKPTR